MCLCPCRPVASALLTLMRESSGAPTRHFSQAILKGPSPWLGRGARASPCRFLPSRIAIQRSSVGEESSDQSEPGSTSSPKAPHCRSGFRSDACRIEFSHSTARLVSTRMDTFGSPRRSSAVFVFRPVGRLSPRWRSACSASPFAIPNLSSRHERLGARAAVPIGFGAPRLSLLACTVAENPCPRKGRENFPRDNLVFLRGNSCPPGFASSLARLGDPGVVQVARFATGAGRNR